MPVRPLETSRASAIKWFSVVWMMAFATHYIDLAPRHSHLIILAAVAAPTLLLAPSSPAAFLGFVLVGTFLAVLDLPGPANHLLLGLLVNVALLGAAAMAFRFPSLPNPRSAVDTGDVHWLDIARVPATWTLLIVYALAFLHKLNWSFLDPAVSCAGDLATQAIAIAGVDATIPGAVVLFLAIATLVIEVLIPLLLVVPSLRAIGILLGFAFHALLAAAGFTDFATFACAIYVLIAIDVVPHIPNGDWWRRRAMVAWGAYLSFASADAVLVSMAGHRLPARDKLLFVSWLVGLAMLMVPLVWTMLFLEPRRHGASLWRRQSAWCLLIPFLAFVNGMAPYLGLKTVSTFSMFSNLRVEEGRSNHLLQPLASLEVTPWMRDTVDVVRFELAGPPELNVLGRLRGGQVSLWSGARWIPGDGAMPVRIPWIELKRTIVRWKDAGVTGVSVGYRHNGIARFVADAVNDAELAAPLPWWTRWLVAFRDIETGTSVKCRW